MTKLTVIAIAMQRTTSAKMVNIVPLPRANSGPTDDLKYNYHYDIGTTRWTYGENQISTKIISRLDFNLLIFSGSCWFLGYLRPPDYRKT